GPETCQRFRAGQQVDAAPANAGISIAYGEHAEGIVLGELIERFDPTIGNRRRIFFKRVTGCEKDPSYRIREMRPSLQDDFNKNSLHWFVRSSTAAAFVAA